MAGDAATRICVVMVLMSRSDRRRARQTNKITADADARNDNRRYSVLSTS
jgi:hypothetical protein